MENYLTLQNALSDLSSNSPIPNDLSQIANLATYGELCPVARYSGLLSIDDNDPITANCFITSHELIDLIDDSQSEIMLQNALIYDGANSGFTKGQPVKLHNPKAYRQGNILIPEHAITRQLLDDLTDPATADKKLIAELYARIDRLENELDKAGEPNTQSDAPADGGKELTTKSQNTVAKIIKALLDLADLNTDDPYSYDKPNSTNKLIYDQLISLDLKVSSQKIGDWIELAKQQTPEK